MSLKNKRPSLRVLFGARVRELRIAARMTQEELAERAKISVDFLSLIERGRNSPSFENIEGLAHALRARVVELFNFNETQQ